MKILVLNHEYPPVGGGGGKVSQDIAEGLVRNGHKVYVLSSLIYPEARVENRNGVTIHRLFCRRKYAYKARLLDMAIFVFASIVYGYRFIKKENPDLIHAHFAVPAGAAAWVLAKITHKPFLITAHLGDVPGGVPEKTGKIFRFIFPFTKPIWRDAVKIIAVSEYTKQLAKKSYPSVSIQVIPNGVNVKEIGSGTIKINNPPQIVYAGRFVEQKNPIQIVRTLASIADLPWHCILIGDGPLHEIVQEEIHKTGLKNRITLVGWVDPTHVINYFMKSDILFMPSLNEGLPVTMVHAMATGLALIVSDVGGCRELIQNDINGYLVNPNHPEEFSKVMRSLLINPQKLLAIRQGSRKSADYYDINKIVDSYETALLQIINGNTLG